MKLEVDEFNIRFGKRLKRLIEQSGYSQRQFCRLIDRQPAYLTPILAGRSGPKLSDFVKMASTLGMTLEDLVNTDYSISIEAAGDAADPMETHAERIVNELFSVVSARAQRLFTPKIDDVLSWIRDTGARISPDNPLSSFVDLHEIPDTTDSILKPAHVGAHSLAARQLGVASPGLLTKMMESLPQDDIQKVVYSYRQVSDKPFELSEQHVSVMMADHGVHFDVHYFRLLHPVQDAKGNKYVLNFSTLADGVL